MTASHVIIEARTTAARPKVPDGFVDRDEACRMFGVTRHVWKRWIREGKVPFGTIISSPTGGKQKIYSLEDLRGLKNDLFGADKLYKGADGVYHVPAGLVRREQAWTMFGVSKATWERWEREGKITCGQRVPGGPKLYNLEDVERMLDEYGRYAPPYPDPHRPGVHRVPLGGRDIRRREALIDSDLLALIEGGTCAWSSCGDGQAGFVSLCHPAVQHATPLRRIIMGVAHAADLNVRHVNGDPLDCRRANLVLRTPKQRVRNNRKIAAIRGQPTTSRFKGVFWETQTKKWRVRIKADGQERSLGRFRDEIAAAIAYDQAARKWFGAHAWLNFPNGVDAWLQKEGYAPREHAAAA